MSSKKLFFYFVWNWQLSVMSSWVSLTCPHFFMDGRVVFFHLWRMLCKSVATVLHADFNFLRNTTFACHEAWALWCNAFGDVLVAKCGFGGGSMAKMCRPEVVCDLIYILGVFTGQFQP